MLILVVKKVNHYRIIANINGEILFYYDTSQADFHKQKNTFETHKLQTGMY